MSKEEQELSVIEKTLPNLDDDRKIAVAKFKTLKNVLYPEASDESVALVIDYCLARKLDPLKKVVHIVPTRRKIDGQWKTVESIWPGIAEYRITAMRTKEYMGKANTEFGATIKQTLGDHEDFVYPEYAQVTVLRKIGGQVCKFVGPRVYWLEAYVTLGQTHTPNAMWSKRAWGQLDKCAEAAALRVAFPEEIGGEDTYEEMAGRHIDVDSTDTGKRPDIPDRRAGARTAASTTSSGDENEPTKKDTEATNIGGEATEKKTAPQTQVESKDDERPAAETPEEKRARRKVDRAAKKQKDDDAKAAAKAESERLKAVAKAESERLGGGKAEEQSELNINAPGDATGPDTDAALPHKEILRPPFVADAQYENLKMRVLAAKPVKIGQRPGFQLTLEGEFQGMAYSVLQHEDSCFEVGADIIGTLVGYPQTGKDKVVIFLTRVERLSDV